MSRTTSGSNDDWQNLRGSFLPGQATSLQMAYERNADPENPFKCQCRYKSMILEKPCSVSHALQLTAFPEPANHEADA